MQLAKVDVETSHTDLAALRGRFGDTSEYLFCVIPSDPAWKRIDRVDNLYTAACRLRVPHTQVPCPLFIHIGDLAGFPCDLRSKCTELPLAIWQLLGLNVPNMVTLTLRFFPVLIEARDVWLCPEELLDAFD